MTAVFMDERQIELIIGCLESEIGRVEDMMENHLIADTLPDEYDEENIQICSELKQILRSLSRTKDN